MLVHADMNGLSIARRLLVTSASLSLLHVAGCGLEAETETETERVSSTTQAIIAGTASTTAQDSVVLVAAVDANGHAAGGCTGTRIAPDLILTTRACVADVADDGTATDVSPSSLAIFTGTTAWQKANANIAPAAHVKRIFTNGTKNLYPDIAVMQLDAKDSGPIAALRMGPAVTDEGLVVIGYGLDGANQLPSTRSQRKGLSVLQVGPSTGTGLEAGEFVTGESMCIGDFGGPAFSTVTKSVIGVSARVGNGSTPTVQNPVAFCTGAGTAAVFTTLVAGKAVLDAAFAASATQPLLESGASAAARAGADAGDGTPADSSEEKVTDGESASAKTLTPSSGCTASGPANTSPWPSMLALLLATALLGRRQRNP